MINLSGLNPPQREAASILSGPLLVLAGAGTGKTRVITYRMANLIAHGIRPDRILSVTFTNKAAREMRERALKLIGKQFKLRPIVSTFHSFCVRVLREDIDSLGYPKKFAIYDRSDQESAARTALRDIRLGDGTMKPSDLINRISKWKMQGIQDHEASSHVEADFDFLAAMAYKRYQKQLRACGAVDFDDLLLLTVKLFKDFPDVLQRHQSKFDHVQVDEYQDTNGVQFQLIESLVKPHRNICVVGDDDQSIYGWRGAEVEHIINFAKYFPNTKTVRLENNYRCTDRILECANRLVKHNRLRHDKTLIPHKKSGSPIRLQAFEDETAEAEGVVQEIAYLISELGVKPKQVAILFRTNEQPRVFEQELRRQKVPYMLVGGQSFFDRREIRDLMAYLKAIENSRDEVSLLRIINTPARGIGDTTTEKILQRAVKKGVSFWDFVPEASAEGLVPAKTLTSLVKFRELLQRYGQVMNSDPKNLAEQCRQLVREIDYESEIAKQYKEETQQETRKTILEEFINSIGQYVERNEDPSLTGFLETTALMDREDEADRNEKQEQDAVRLMTLHSAKGLEFPRVYLIGMEEGFLPHKRSIDADSEKDIAEERRLAYVGVTRAMDHLTLTRAKSRMKWGKRRETVPSRFLFEMQAEPGEALPEVSIERQEGVGIPIMPMGESSPFQPRPTILPSSAKLSAPPPNEFEAPPF
ncbi:MAG: UvrD-helicase domain-containing protein [Planctomycetales bacterium]|jgi:DNA helicase II / ATP-dependent DNA helicase PcrA|nr:UvrD-helicase domain-containing protein [Planctomycetales bacterium]